MKIANFIRTLFVGLILAMVIPAASATTLQQAMSELSTAKEQGLVGERQNGYLGIVSDEGNASEIVRLINDARRTEYTRIADSNNIAVSDVEAMAGRRAIERTAPGQFIQLDDQWVRKR